MPTLPGMGILREPKVWRKTRGPRETAPPDELTPIEEARVRAGVIFLFRRFGGWAALARAMGVKRKTLWQAARRRRRRPTAGLALRAARVAHVRVESILAGRWPTPGADPKRCAQTWRR